jgi:hypothetical protein
MSQITINQMGWDFQFVTTGAFALEANSHFSSASAAFNYIKNDKTAYVGKYFALTAESTYEDKKYPIGLYVVTGVGTSPSIVGAGTGSGSLAIANFTIEDDKIKESTADNIGQVIYITTGTETYPAGPYIAIGDGKVSKLGTTTATGDIDGDVEALKTKVGNLEAADGEIKDSISGIKADIYDGEGKLLIAKASDVYSKTDAEGKFDTIESVNAKVKAVDDKTVTNAEAISNLGTQLQEVKDSYATKKSVEDLTTEVAKKATQDALNEVDAKTATNASAITSLEGEVSTIKSTYATKTELQGVQDKIVDYTIKPITTAEGYASTYQLFKGDAAVSDSVINIPLDQVLKSAEIKVVADDNTPYEGAIKGDKYIEFSFQNTEALQYLPVQDLVDVYSAGSYINIDNSNSISVDYDGIYRDVKTQIVTDLSLATTTDVSTAKSEAIAAAATAAETAISAALEDYSTTSQIDTKLEAYAKSDKVKEIEDGYKAADAKLQESIETLNKIVVGGEGEGIEAIISDLNEVMSAVGKPAGTDSEGNPTEATGFHKDIETISLTVSGNTNAINDLKDSVVKSISLNGTEIKPTSNVVTLPVSYSFDDITTESKDLVSGGAVKNYVDTAVGQINLDISALTNDKLSGKVVNTISVETATNNTLYLVGEQHIPQIKLNDTLYTIGNNYYARKDIFAGEGTNGLMTASMFAKLEDIEAINDDALDDILAK